MTDFIQSLMLEAFVYRLSIRVMTQKLRTIIDDTKYVIMSIPFRDSSHGSMLNYLQVYDSIVAVVTGC